MRAAPLVLVLLVFAFALSGCKRDPQQFTAILSKTQPDEHGVVCYTYGHTNVLSCVKVR